MSGSSSVLSESGTALEAIYAATVESFDRLLTSEALLAEAQAATGLSDWGGERWEEAGFRRRFGTLCASLENEAQLNVRGRARAHSRLHLMLCSRLRQVDWRAHRSEGPPIVAPLLGTGLPRAGTTFLHNLLAQDPAHVSATAAQAAMPVPPAGGRVDAERNEVYRRVLDFQGFTGADVTAIHPYAADMPEECVFLQEASCAVLFGAFFDVPGYAQAAAPDIADAYAWQIGVMHTLQEGRDAERWALKAPGHMLNWEAMIAAFPDARIFMNHRDPGKVIPSMVGLYAKLRSLFSDRVADPKPFARQLVSTWSGVLDKVTAWRTAHPEIPVFDVRYTDLVADPIGEAERLYAAFGLDLRAEARARMERFLETDRHGKGPARAYGLADYGLDEAVIEEAFGPYIDRYGVARERRA